MNTMKRNTKVTALAALAFALLLIPLRTFAVSYTATNTGNWATTTTWSPNGTPGASDTVLIKSGKNVTTATTASITSFTVENGGTLTLGSKLTVSGTSSVTGLVTCAASSLGGAGNITVENGGVLRFTGAALSTYTGVLTFNNGARYDHNFTGGTIPTATWNTGSTCEITGWTTTTTAIAGIAQNFYNLIWNSPGQTGTENFSGGLTGVTIGGDFIVRNTGGTELRLTGTSTYSFTVLGNLILEGSTNSIAMGNNTGTGTINIGGKLIVFGSYFVRSAGGSSGGTYTVNASNDVLVASGGKLVRGSTGTCNFNFAANGTQVFTNGGIVDSNIVWTVNATSTLDLGTNVIAGTGSFANTAGSVLKSASAGGLASTGTTGNIQTTTRTFSPNATYEYNGTVAQAAGSGLPTTVKKVVVNNSTGVTLSATTTMTNLSGTGSVGSGVTVSGNGTLTPGNGGVGTITVTNLTITASGTNIFELTNSVTVGSGVNDLVLAYGTLTPNGSKIAISVLGSTPLDPGTYRLFDYSGGSISGSFDATPIFTTAVTNAANTTALIQDDGTHINLLIASSSCVPPAISVQPTDQTTCSGSSASFSVTASGTTVSYRWRKNGVNLTDGGAISGATTATLTINPVSSGNAGTSGPSGSGYDCVITEALSGPCTTNTARVALTVNSAPSITTQPTSVTNIENTSASFTVVATGTAPLSYAWYKGGSLLVDGGNISGASTATLTLNPVALTNAGNYVVVVSNLCGSVTSSPAATLTVLASKAWVGNASQNDWDLSTANWQGATAFANGDITVFDDAGVSSVPVNITATVSPTSTTVSSSSNYTFSGTGKISGAATLAKSGSGNLAISTANDYTGVTTVGGGSVSVQNDAALGTTAGSTIVSNGAALNVDGSSLNVAEPVTASGVGIASAGVIRNLANNNTYSGAVTLGSAARINSDAGTLTLAGGVNGAGNALTLGGAGNTAVSTTAISGTGTTVTKDGSGTLTLSAASTYTGVTTVSNGVLNLQNATATGTTAGGVSVVSGAALEVQGSISVGAEALALNGSGISSGGALRNVSGANSWAGAVTLGSAARINSDSGTLTLTGGVVGGGNALTIGGAGNTTVSTTAISGSGTSLVKEGSGTLTLSLANTYTGSVDLNAGVLNFSTLNALGTGTTLNINGGTLQYASGNTADISGRTVNINSGGATIDTGANVVTLANGTINGTGTLIKVGSGDLRFNANTTARTGDTILREGRILVDQDGQFSSTNAGGSSATFYMEGGQFSQTASGRTVGNSHIFSVVVRSNSVIGTESTSTGTIDVYFGGTNVNAFTSQGGSLTVSNGNGTGVLQLRVYAPTFNFTNGIVLLGNSRFSTYSASGTGTISGVISGTGTVHRRSSTAGVAGETVFSGDNTFSGGSALSDGSIGLGISSTGSPTVTSGPLGTGTFAIGSTASSVISLYASGGARTLGNSILFSNAQPARPLIIKGSDDLTLSGLIDLGTNTVNFQIDNTAATEFSGVLTNGGVTKTGNGTLKLSAANVYTGATTVSAGRLLVNGSLSAGSAVGVTNGGTLGGTGTINGTVTVSSGSTLSPGASIGTLTLGAAPSLSGTVLAEIDRSASPNADKVTLSSGTLTYGGTLTVTNLGGTPQNGDTFDLFDASAFSGSFATLNLPTGGAVHWRTASLTVDGTISFTNNQPTIGNLSVSHTAGTSYKIKKSDLGAADLDGDTLTYSLSTTTNGVTLTQNATYIFVPTNSVDDEFTVTVNDGVGGSASGTVHLTILAGTGQTTASIDTSGGNPALTFYGIPGNSYTIQVSTDLSTWTDVNTSTAGSTGVITYTDTAPPTPAAYYRLKAN